MLSPTKPLVEQHAAFFRRVHEHRPGAGGRLHGQHAARERQEIWKNSTVIISTPQVIENDVICKRFDLSGRVADHLRRGPPGDGQLRLRLHRQKIHGTGQDPADPGHHGVAGQHAGEDQRGQGKPVHRAGRAEDRGRHGRVALHLRQGRRVGQGGRARQGGEIKILLDVARGRPVDKLRSMGVFYGAT